MNRKKDERIRVFSGAAWESKAAYCRAIRTGSQIEVSGTTSVSDSGDVVGAGNAYLQTQRCFEIIGTALAQLGAGLSHITRTRMFTTDMGLWEDIARAHRDTFADAPPASTLVEVTRLIHPDLLIEIEVTATLPDERG